MLTSKKVILSKLYSEVNFIEGWKEFKLWRNFFNSSSECGHSMSMSSIKAPIKSKFQGCMG